LLYPAGPSEIQGLHQKDAAPQEGARPISPGVILNPEDVPELPDQRKQKYYRSFVAKLQFAATWVRIDIAFTVSQLARFCASAGVS
jgi:hypothetical protein